MTSYWKQRDNNYFQNNNNKKSKLNEASLSYLLRGNFLFLFSIISLIRRYNSSESRI